ncbi:DUF2125 domain-containing protein [Dongia soli]|uniref:DUF2125 domain-containing protein n=1 Tax=Dongia soli TaxID=600628 RepID=A0ABU5E726_9PROT|nr:DUF2125 domain-containing protein [Dongia soli]MDY0881358.1 DUF2125 domain-containing protein [Dongia soli]
MTPRRRLVIRLLLPICLAILLIAGYGIYWWQVARQLEAGIAAWTAEQRAQGAVVQYQGGKVHGFPFTFTADFSDISLLGRWSGTDLSVRTAALRLNLSPLDLTLIRFAADGPVTVILPEIALETNTNGTAGVRLTANRAAGQVDLRNGVLAALSVDAGRSKLDNGKNAIGLGSLHLGLALPPTPPSNFNDPAADIALAATNIDLPAGPTELLPGPILQAGLRGTIRGPLEAAADDQAAHSVTEILTRWRDIGGVVDVARFDFAQGPLSLTGSGTFALDQNLQPLGASKVTATGLGELIDLMIARGQIVGKDAQTAKMVVAGLAKPGTNGRPEVTLSFSIQDSIVSFGPLRLMRLAPIPWPQ